MANTCSSESSSSSGIAVLVWSAVARSSQAHGAKQVVTVRPYDTLWSIAQRHYGGDVARRDLADRAGEPPAGRRRPRRARRSSCRRRAAQRPSLRHSAAAWTSTSSFSARRRARRPRSRAPTALLVRRGGERLLFDCAEGTQRQLMRSTLGLPDLEEIFLTHFHADHYLGLPGMLKTFSLRQRELPLTVYGPPGLRELFESLAAHRREAQLPGRARRGAAAARRSSATATGSSSSRCTTASRPSATRSSRTTGPARFDVEAADALGVPIGPERGALQRGESITLADGRVAHAGRGARAPRVPAGAS